jgi:hypothetical protein
VVVVDELVEVVDDEDDVLLVVLEAVAVLEVVELLVDDSEVLDEVVVVVVVGAVKPLRPQAVSQRPSSPPKTVPRTPAYSLNAQKTVSSVGSSAMPL